MTRDVHTCETVSVKTDGALFAVMGAALAANVALYIDAALGGAVGRAFVVTQLSLTTFAVWTIVSTLGDKR